MDVEMLTIEEVSRLLRVSERTVRRLIEKGELAAIEVSTRSYRIMRSDLNAYIERKRSGRHDEPRN